MSLALKSHCKVNLLLNVISRRSDGFHELETIFQPVPLYDELSFEKSGHGVELSCSDSRLATCSENLVYRAAAIFLKKIQGVGVKIHLQKSLPISAGIGAGSSNAAFTLRGLNELYGQPLDGDCLHSIAAELGSDVPFFLQDEVALGSGRGEEVRSVKPFEVLSGKGLLIINPGFGVSTPWAYERLASTPGNYGKSGQLDDVVTKLRSGDLSVLFNSLELPVFEKYVVLSVIKKFLMGNGALSALMSGSGSTTFAITEDRPAAESLREKYHQNFGQTGWSATVSL